MFLEKQTKEQREYYARMLEAVGSLSKLFSESNVPYLAYRATENLFCKSFEADNLSRSDASADASKNSLGFGIKTFLNNNGRTMQKVAEFNREHNLFNSLEPEEKIKKIVELRNERLESTKRIFKIDDLIYHCIVREDSRIMVFEQPISQIKVDDIKDLSVNKSSIYFNDGKEEYKFSLSKSTLYKRFLTDDVLLDINVKILDDPFEAIEKLLSEGVSDLEFAPIKKEEHLFLPLYSTRGDKHVPEKSGLNQWNASGRPRDYNEIYIPIPAWIHQKFPNFFPPRDVPFNLILPNKETLNAKLCQDNSKALMSNPNSALGKWLLRDVLNLKEGELLTYDNLERIGLDSVVIYKIDDQTYDIDFTRVGAYEEFEQESLENNG